MENFNNYFDPKKLTWQNYVTIALVTAIAISMFYSCTVSLILTLAYCGFKCYEYWSQPVIHHKSRLSMCMLLMATMFQTGHFSVVQNHPLYSHEMENGSYIVSGTVTGHYTTEEEGRRTYTACHTQVSFLLSDSTLSQCDIIGQDTYDNTEESKPVIIAMPYRFRHYEVVDFQPSESTVDEFRLGKFSKGVCSDLSKVSDDAEVRAMFESDNDGNVLKTLGDMPILASLLLFGIVFALGFFFDRASYYAVFGVLALLSIASYMANAWPANLFAIMVVGAICQAFMYSVGKKSRVRNEIMRNGGVIAVGVTPLSSGTSAFSHVKFCDPFGNSREEEFMEQHPKPIIIGYSISNGFDIICLDEQPTDEMLSYYSTGKVVGPCKEIDLSSHVEDEGLKEWLREHTDND